MSCSGGAENQQVITVAAASDLRQAFGELGTAFTKQSGVTVEFSFGSSGQLREQIINGAPFDVYASANSAYVDDVINAGKGDVKTRAVYAMGRLALVVSKSKSIPANLVDLQDTDYRRIVIANPQHAPYGLAAKQTLVSLGIFGAMQDRLIYGENISDALRIVQSGNADAALVALSLVIQSNDEYLVVPESLHQPISQTLVVTAPQKTKSIANSFVKFVTSRSGLAIMSRYGYVQPDPASTVTP
ncbi:MAG: molybdate ABC transporter substrate-binding protein [Acidimicrobiaceae bacterium]|nr:molybdate ABC transporter substrate-binding protein [Acidimicrobiaceae bacterium]